jgi:hypothetical protein
LKPWKTSEETITNISLQFFHSHYLEGNNTKQRWLSTSLWHKHINIFTYICIHVCVLKNKCGAIYASTGKKKSQNSQDATICFFVLSLIQILNLTKVTRNLPTPKSNGHFSMFTSFYHPILCFYSDVSVTNGQVGICTGHLMSQETNCSVICIPHLS